MVQGGKLEKRTNTFNDFVDVAKGLIERGYTSAGRIAIAGGSAGGELMGAVVNSDPELWGAVVADVPFVDVLNTMLDADAAADPGRMARMGQSDRGHGGVRADPQLSAPTTMSSAQAYPPLLVTAGLNDPRVTYWEPAKWVAKLRATEDRRQRCCCSRPIWARAMAASRAGSKACTKRPRSSPSSCGSWGWRS